MEKEIIAVSACLLGVSCRYDGCHNLNTNVLKYLKGKEIIPICPEVFGAMTTPRIPSEIQSNGKVYSETGKDVTANFDAGKEMAWEIIARNGCKKAILKDGSPSCGYKTIYDGSFTNRKIGGLGTTAKLLIEKGMQIIDLDT